LPTLAPPLPGSARSRPGANPASRDPADSLRDGVAWLSETAVGGKGHGAGC